MLQGISIKKEQAVPFSLDQLDYILREVIMKMQNHKRRQVGISLEQRKVNSSVVDQILERASLIHSEIHHNFSGMKIDFRMTSMKKSRTFASSEKGG